MRDNKEWASDRGNKQEKRCVEEEVIRWIEAGIEKAMQKNQKLFDNIAYILPSLEFKI